MQAPIEPEIFDELAKVYDDPSVVRYSQNIRQITAATPARIIAQISSESFMDYDLVSDFFLTFRSYMSTTTVLDLLMARLRWAIGRLEDDGRVIRIRTFAALRHWILNYFLDDFVVNRQLRLRFCDKLNKLYTDVQARPDGGHSDIKILRDLKRCWNGRCSLYWDSEDFAVDKDHDAELMPGGVIGTRDPTLTDVTEHGIQMGVPPPPLLAEPAQSWFGKPPTPRIRGIHESKPSTPPPQAAQSLRSDMSIQPSSCALPMKAPRTSGNPSRNLLGPHPVSVQSRRQNAPSNLVVTTHPDGGRPYMHKRGASSIDSTRERTPRGDASSTLHLAQDHAGSIIRGNAFAPATPFVQISMGVHGSTSAISTATTTDASNNRHVSPSPAVKNIIGSIRRALSHRHGNGNVSFVTVSAPQSNPTLGRNRSHLPLMISKSHDELRRESPQIATRTETRIDLLCAAALESFEANFLNGGPDTDNKLFLENGPYDRDEEVVRATDDLLRTHRMASQATAQSGSILIVDDTGLDMPAMSGALRQSLGVSLSVDNAGNMTAQASQTQRTPDASNLTPPSEQPPTQRSSGVLGHAVVDDLQMTEGLRLQGYPHSDHGIVQYGADYHKATTLERGLFSGGSGLIENESASSSASTLRYHRSSTAGGDGIVELPDATQTPISPSQQREEELDEDSRVPTQTLRRRPGGDLRKVENVHDLEVAVHHESFDSMALLSDSTKDSFLMMREHASAEAPVVPLGKKPISMIKTHSSQHLRPSFEAAVSGFSSIPDDDDGGFEATLLKLEGRYERLSPPIAQYPTDMAARRQSMPDLATTSILVDHNDTNESLGALHHYPRPDSEDLLETTSKSVHHLSNLEEDEDHDQAVSRKSSIFGLPTGSVTSDDSYNAMPILGGNAAPGDARNMRQLYTDERPQEALDSVGDLRRSIPRPYTANESSASARSFLLDEDEDLSDLSSEISVDIINYSGTGPIARSFSPMIAAPGTAVSGLEIPSHPLVYASRVDLVDTQHHSVERYLEMLRGPPTPEASPIFRQGQREHSKLSQMQHASYQKINAAVTASVSSGPVHIPFVLACDSLLLAQQFTLVEKSALGEIEWNDLVEMRWENKPSGILDWPEYLAKTDIKGIDMVVTRFNLMVKWVLSEIVLTQGMHERARVMTKYIHVAAHARRLHNYATMLQITIALTSTDCTRLVRTWELVSAPDRSLLRNMETLVQPIRNFQDLRLEMESADLTDGCVPFIGTFSG